LGIKKVLTKFPKISSALLFGSRNEKTFDSNPYIVINKSYKGFSDLVDIPFELDELLLPQKN